MEVPRVRQVMDDRTYAVRESDDVFEAVEHLLKHEVTGVPVVDDAERVVGLEVVEVEDRDEEAHAVERVEGGEEVELGHRRVLPHGWAALRVDEPHQRGGARLEAAHVRRAGLARRVGYPVLFPRKARSSLVPGTDTACL